MKIFVIVVLLFIFLIVVCLVTAILIKKKIFYTYIEKNKNLSMFDYLMDYDGNWLLKNLEYNKISNEERNKALDKLIMLYKTLHKLAIIFFVILFGFGVIMKIKGVV